MFNILYHLFHPDCKQQCSVTLKRTIDEKFSRQNYYVPKIFKYELLSRCRHDSNASPFTSKCLSKVGECVVALCVPSSHQNKPRFFFSFLFGGLCLFVNKMAIPIRQYQDHRHNDDDNPDDDDDDPDDDADADPNDDDDDDFAHHEQ